MTVWKKIENGDVYVIALYNFDPTSPRHLRLVVGELVRIDGESRDWYWGQSTRRDARGAFPKNYVIIQNRGEKARDAVATSGSADVVEFITQTLHEWLRHLKKLYLANDARFASIKTNMSILMQLRTQIASETMPQEELKRFSKTARFTIDSGNRTLGLDLVVRHDCGRQVHPLLISAYQLNKLHEEADSMFETCVNNTAKPTPPTFRTYTVVGKITNFVSRLHDELELSLAIFNEQGVQLTENVLVQWASPHLAAAELVTRPPFVITDLSHDMAKKSFLVCHVVRLGGMEMQSSDRYRRTIYQRTPARLTHIRRPCGIACTELTSAAGQDEKEIQLPFFACEKETMESLLKILITNREFRDRKQSCGIWMNIRLVEGGIKHIWQENPHLLRDPQTAARKMGFPDVILPEDARNDFYVTLVGGAFSRDGKPCERNIEVIAKVYKKKDKAMIPGAISRGAGAPSANEYTSMVYYHEDRPRWQEVFKISLNIEEFKEAHIVFLLRHRSSNEAKDRIERYFALSYLSLMQLDGTTTSDTEHNLAVYKIDSKRGFITNDMDDVFLDCLNLCSLRDDPAIQCKYSHGALLLQPRDVLVVTTKLCSTKLTQREEILGVLNWRIPHSKGELRQALRSLLGVPSDELVKFLHDILDALFLILSQFGEEKDFTDDSYSVLVFDCLLLVLSLVTEQKYKHFKPVLQVYIEESFSHALAYEQLLPVIVWTIRSLENDDLACKRLHLCLKSLENLMRLIVRSRHLREALYVSNEKTDYCPYLQSFLEALVWLMRHGQYAIACQGAAIKYLPDAIPHLVKIFPKNLLSHYTVSALEELSPDKLPGSRLKALIQLINGPLGVCPGPRKKLLPHLAFIICHLLRKVTEVELCVEAFGEMMSLLARKDVGPVEDDIRYITRATLRSVSKKASNMMKERDHNKLSNEKLLRKLISILMDLWKNMNEEQCAGNSNLPLEYGGAPDVVSVSCGLMMAMLEHPVFPSHWADMLDLQHYVILHTLSLESEKLCRKLEATDKNDFEAMGVMQSLLVRWFCTVGAVATSTPLQLESLRASRQKRTLDLFGDIRIRAATVMVDTWKSLGVHKRLFIPQLIGPFLQVSFIRNQEVRIKITPLFFDMIQALYNATSKRGAANIKLIEEKLIDEVELLVKVGWGDAEWGQSFIAICGGVCASADRALKEVGGQLLAAVVRQLNALLQYHAAPPSQRVYLILNVLSFYKEIGRPDLYLNYVHHLANFHRNDGHRTEAALALQLHAKLLEWRDIPLPQTLRHLDKKFTETHLELKINLYEESVGLLERDRQWEPAAHLLHELARVRQQYAHRVLLAELHKQLSDLYKESLQQPLIPHTYFRVRYLGRGFPDYLREPLGFVYRGNECEMLQSFKERMLEKFPGAEVLLKLDEPGQDITESDGQYLQINSVTPIMAEKWGYLLECKADEDVIRYYERNDVTTFEFSRPFYRADDLLSDTSDAKVPNEFATMWLERTEITIADALPGILRFFPVVSSKTYFLSPLEGAVEAIEKSNKELKRAIMAVKAPGDSLLLLTLKLQGTLDARVQGGLENYERTFFTDKYATFRPEQAPLLQRLRDRIGDQVELLAQGLRIHEMHSTETELHAHLVDRYRTVYKQYGASYTEDESPEVEQISTVVLRTISKRLPESETRSNYSRNSDMSSGNESTASKSKYKICSVFNNWNRHGIVGTLPSQRKRNKKVEKRTMDKKKPTLSVAPEPSFVSNLPTELTTQAVATAAKDLHNAGDSDPEEAPPELPPKPGREHPNSRKTSFNSRPAGASMSPQQLRIKSMPPKINPPPLPPKNQNRSERKGNLIVYENVNQF